MCRAEQRVAVDLMFCLTGGRVQPGVIFRGSGSAEDEPDSASFIITRGRKLHEAPLAF